MSSSQRSPQETSHEVSRHIELTAADLEGNSGLGRYVLLPGDPARAAKIGNSFEALEVRKSARGFHAYSGHLAAADRSPIDVLAISTGIGGGSTEVVVHELIECGARRLVRVGSCGTGAPPITAGQVVIVTAAVRDEMTTAHYVPVEFPAAAHPLVVEAMSEGARRCDLEGETFRGICHSKASLFAREFGHGPLGERNDEYCEAVKGCGVVASEMEASTLFILAAAAGGVPRSLDREAGGSDCQAGAVLAVYATDDSNMRFDRNLAARAEQRAIRVAVEGIRVWAEKDRRERSRTKS